MSAAARHRQATLPSSAHYRNDGCTKTGWHLEPDQMAAAAVTIGCRLSWPHITRTTIPDPDPAVILVTNNATETRWWQDLARHSTAWCFIHGRLRWKSTLQGQIALYFGDDVPAFRTAFSRFGTTCKVSAPTAAKRTQ